MKLLISQYKQELKNQALEIRTMKGQRKGAKNGYVSGLLNAQHSYRLKHIAYCMMRGRKYEEIERTVHNKLSDKDWTGIKRLMTNTKMYVIVRRDLHPSQQTVQACHAVSSLLLNGVPKERVETWNHTKVILGVDTAKELSDWHMKMWRLGSPKAHLFYEPDIKQYTAMAILLQGDEGEALKELKLL